MRRIEWREGFSQARVAETRIEGEPHAGFWSARTYYPKRQGGVASSRREDPRYRSGEKTRRSGRLAGGNRQGAFGGRCRSGGGPSARQPLPLGEMARSPAREG